MRTFIIAAISFLGATAAQAQVKQIEMRIDDISATFAQAQVVSLCNGSAA